MWGFRREATITDGVLRFKFDTAWKFPLPIFKKLAKMYPGLIIDVVCFDEGWVFAGVGRASNGLAIFEKTQATEEMYEAVYGHRYEH